MLISMLAKLAVVVPGLVSVSGFAVRRFATSRPCRAAYFDSFWLQDDAPTAQHGVASVLGLDAYLKRIKKQDESDVRTIVWPSTQLDMQLSTRLVGAAFGVEGQAAFPSLFRETYSWAPSPQLTQAVKFAVMRELSKAAGTNLQDNASVQYHIYLHFNFLFLLQIHCILLISRHPSQSPPVV